MNEITMSVNDLNLELRLNGLEQYADQLTALARPSTRLVTELMDDSLIDIGLSKVGGRPDLPDHLYWPSFRGLPMSFIAQIDLAEVHEWDLNNVLPDQGVLSFFYDSSQHVWGFDP